jgi:hypothetical protein
MGKIYISLGKDNREFYSDALRTSLVSTGYSYWQEDHLEIPEDIHREIALFMDSELEKYGGYLEKELFMGRDPYDCQLRYEIAKEHSLKRDYISALEEYNNALYCCDNKDTSREILKEAYRDAKNGGLNYLTNIIEHDLKIIR